MEYGGYLPLELKSGSEYFTRYQDASFVGFNSGRSCIVAALDNMEVSRVYIPFYNCHVIEKALIQNGYVVSKYILDEDFLPIIHDFADNDWLVYVDYFGLADSNDTKQKVVKQYQRVIIDNTQAFYSIPILKEDIFNVYSCRKFFGVSDGAYLVYKKGLDIKVPYNHDVSWKRAGFLLKSIEMGTNGAYKENLISEESIGFSVKLMSSLTRNILKSIDYDSIQLTRKNNFRLLHNVFHTINMLKFDSSEKCTPMIYPLMVKDDSLRKKLVREKIYVPQWWKYLIDELSEESIEIQLSKYLFPLPIDQRYKDVDIIQLSKIVKELIEEEG